jgi:ATP-binding cassette, subfamily B (MDR/TAP), member 1
VAAPAAGQQSIEVASLADGRREELSQSVPKKAWEQFLGLRPFKTSYFSLYRPLKTKKDKAILAAAIILSMAAGVPLPLIGVIFGKVINGFPPDNHELNEKLTHLMIVAACYFVVTWGWATCWGMVGERVSRGLREAVLEKAVGMDMAWFEVEGVDVSNLPVIRATRDEADLKY